jgi:cell shape-determining protein MreC
VQTNQAVLTMEGLVGRVTSVGLTRSQVVLVGDPNCKVAALIEETRAQGVVWRRFFSFRRRARIRFVTLIPNRDSVVGSQSSNFDNAARAY